MMCVFGCFCNDGYLRYNGSCVLPADCPATTTPPTAIVPQPAAGAQNPIDVSDPDVIAAALCAMDYENARSNSLYTLQLVDIESATVQVVAGIRYDLNLLAGPSQACRNDGSAHTLSECPVDESASSIFKATVVMQPWLSPACSVISFTGTPSPAISGGRTTADVTSDAVLSAAACAVQQENARSNSLYALQLVAVTSATSQVVSGVRYNLVLQAGFSSCMNDGTARTLAECPVTSASAYQVCVRVCVRVCVCVCVCVCVFSDECSNTSSPCYFSLQ
jgi:hypothetical protein